MKTSRHMFVALLAVAGLAAPPSAGAQGSKKKQQKEDLDYLELATVLVRDKHYERASNTLAQVDTEDEDTDLARFHFLRGVVRLNLGLYSQAAEDFEASITNGQTDPVVSVYSGQAYFYSNQYEKCIEAFLRAQDKAREIQATFAMRAEAYWKLERFEDSWRILNEGMELYPDYHELLRRKTFQAIEKNLYRTASELGRIYLQRADASSRDYLAIGSALYRSGSVDSALQFLEIAHLRYSDELEVTTELARVYKERGQYRTAANLLERAALRTGKDEVLVEAAELYRKAEEPYKALALNARVAQSEKRLRQRLSVLVELRRYEMVAAMERDLRRVGLMKDDTIRYAVAYAHFKTKDYQRAETLLSGISSPDIFRQATELRKAMEDCRDEQWRC